MPQQHKRCVKNNQLWIVVFGLLSFFILVEGAHLNYHRSQSSPSDLTKSIDNLIKK